MNNRTYSHLNDEDRYTIQIRYKDKVSIRMIAKELKKSPSTISREIKRNGKANLPSISYKRQNINSFYYSANQAIIKTKKRKSSYHLSHKYNYFYQELAYNSDSRKSIYHNYADVLKKDKFKLLNKPTLRTIYNWINDNPIKFSALIRKKNKKYNYKKATIPKEVVRKNIAMRNEIFNIQFNNYNHEPGHLEADLIEGSNHKSHVLTLVDRSTMLFFSRKVISKKASHVNHESSNILNEIKFDYNINIKSLTTDNGSEFIYSEVIEKAYNIQWYYCTPYSSWQRALNERLNRDFRRIYPKGTNFNNVSISDVKNVENYVNSLRRIRFNHLTSKEYIKISFPHSQQMI